MHHIPVAPLSWPRRSRRKVDVPSLGADVYVSNGHKWCFTPKGAAFLWVSKALQGASDPYGAPGTAVYPTVSACPAAVRVPFKEV